MAYLVSSEQISRIYLILYIVKTGIVTIRYYGMAFFFELFQIVDNFASEEGRAVFQSRFVDYYRSTFSFDPFHDSLNGRLTEIVGV